MTPWFPLPEREPRPLPGEAMSSATAERRRPRDMTSLRNGGLPREYPRRSPRPKQSARGVISSAPAGVFHVRSSASGRQSASPDAMQHPPSPDPTPGPPPSGETIRELVDAGAGGRSRRARASLRAPRADDDALGATPPRHAAAHARGDARRASRRLLGRDAQDRRLPDGGQQVLRALASRHHHARRAPEGRVAVPAARAALFPTTCPSLRPSSPR